MSDNVTESPSVNGRYIRTHVMEPVRMIIRSATTVSNEDV